MIDQNLLIFFIVLGVAILGSLVTRSNLDWYSQLVQPAGAPPNSIFSIWFVLYLLILLGTVRALNCRADECLRCQILTAFILQMFLNLLWSIIFFGQRDPVSALYIILALDLVVIVQMVLMFKSDPVAVALFVPYILWLLYATYLNYQVVRLNYPGLF